MDLPFKDLRAILGVQGGTILVHGEESIDVSYVRMGGRLAKLGGFEPGEAPWDVSALAGGLRFFQRQADRFTVQRMGLIDGELGAPVEINLQGEPFDWMQAPLAGFVIISVLVIVLILRPLIDKASSEPGSTLAPWPLSRRIAALIIDCIPGSILVMAIFGLSPGAFAESFLSIQAEN